MSSGGDSTEPPESAAGKADAERDPSGRRRDEVGEDVGESPQPDDPARPTGGETPRDRDRPDTKIDPAAGENPS